jgi:hypothetical protein
MGTRPFAELKLGVSNHGPEQIEKFQILSQLESLIVPDTVLTCILGRISTQDETSRTWNGISRASPKRDT